MTHVEAAPPGLSATPPTPHLLLLLLLVVLTSTSTPTPMPPPPHYSPLHTVLHMLPSFYFHYTNTHSHSSSYIAPLHALHSVNTSLSSLGSATLSSLSLSHSVAGF